MINDADSVDWAGVADDDASSGCEWHLEAARIVLLTANARQFTGEIGKTHPLGLVASEWRQM